MSDNFERDRRIPTGHKLDSLRKQSFLSYVDLARAANITTETLERILKHINQMRAVKIGDIERVAEALGVEFFFFVRDAHVEARPPYPSIRKMIIDKAMSLQLGPDELARAAGIGPEVTRSIDQEDYKHVKIGKMFLLTNYLDLRFVFHLRDNRPRATSEWAPRENDHREWQAWDGGPPKMGADGEVSHDRPPALVYGDDDPLDFLEIDTVEEVEEVIPDEDDDDLDDFWEEYANIIND